MWICRESHDVFNSIISCIKRFYSKQYESIRHFLTIKIWAVTHSRYPAEQEGWFEHIGRSTRYCACMEPRRHVGRTADNGNSGHALLPPSVGALERKATVFCAVFSNSPYTNQLSVLTQLYVERQQCLLPCSRGQRHLVS